MPIYKDGKLKNEDGLQKYKVRINYQDAKGDNRQLTRVAYGLQQAKQLEILLLSENKGTEASKKIGELYEIYYDRMQYVIRETTLVKKRERYRNYIESFFADVNVQKLNTKLLSQWCYEINQKKLKVSTKRGAYSELRAFLNWCVKNDYLISNPLDKVDNFKDAYEKPAREKIRYYTADEFKIYIATAKDLAEETNDYDFYTFFMIAFYTGMRKSEIKALKWSDFLDGNIIVSRAISEKVKGKIVEAPPKNKASYRTFKCPNSLLIVLDEQFARHKELTQNTDDLRICGAYQIIKDSTIDRHNRKHAIKANVRRITIHEFRHSHASLLANNNINIQEIARRLGHSDVQETWKTYSHLYPQAEELAIKVLDSI